MREHVSRQKKTTTSFSIPSLKQPIRGFGLESSAISRQAIPKIQPLHKPVTHDISRIPLRTQAKLSISQPGDKYEQEADSVAQQVMQTMAQPGNPQSIHRETLPDSEELQMKPLANSITPLVQREALPEDEEELQTKSLDNRTLQREALPEDEEELQMKSLDNRTLQRQEVPEDEEELQMKSLDNRTLQRQEVPEDEEELQMKPMVQRQANAGMAAAPDLEASINQARGGGQLMADNIREPMEVAFGADFSKVKVHTDGQSDQLNRSIQARAFTTGQDVFFRSGEYNPGSRGGQELLAHELTHVVQQNGGVLDTTNVQRVWGSGLPASVKAPPTEDQKAKANAEEQEKKKAQEQEQHQQEVQSFINKIEDFILKDDGTADGTKTGRWNYFPTFKISQKICDDVINAWRGKSGQNYHVLDSHRNNEGYINFLRKDPKKSSSTKSVNANIHVYISN
ncbi:DUF4157 domain-containing protein [Nostoc sp. ChiSLP03a]|uniref:eCIS core domain-containing protein n=1 Tax=Nostoc sp. ChiSLP03a TaxID=3075380 RepID=UPI002AD29604|nr:DUF4157 domain-containing protein [Nostoc sp. ChiSLP03a]MDZ8215961.1 DUF4157 domain-containing protein [Nostoc sp. ChiSLP03a]